MERILRDILVVIHKLWSSLPEEVADARVLYVQRAKTELLEGEIHWGLNDRQIIFGSGYSRN